MSCTHYAWEPPDSQQTFPASPADVPGVPGKAGPPAAPATISARQVLTLVGLTYLFGIAEQNGTVELVVRWCAGAVRGRVAAMPWIFFLLSGLLVSVGALFAVAIVAPVAMPFARRFGVSLLMTGMMVVHGALAGAFSPISVHGSFVQQVLAGSGLPSSPMVLFLAPLLFNTVVAAVVFTVPGGRRLVGARVDRAAHVAHGRSGSTTVAPAEPARGAGAAGARASHRCRGPGQLVDGPAHLRGADLRARPGGGGHHPLPWRRQHRRLRVPVLVALLLCWLTGLTSALASSVAILGITIPLAVPTAASSSPPVRRSRGCSWLSRPRCEYLDFPCGSGENALAGTRGTRG
ncbi:SLC13 family permease [Saccharopolyspora thermophila]|uniref:SLC13 family permease n=1 Tax=Saccharopolyspora thermophila TaxID=89367 RepID=UPI00227B0AF3|nr:SLC13 family permease [Saccharopolyspora subtropica]